MKCSRIVILSSLLIIGIIILTPFFIKVNLVSNNNTIYNTGKLSVEKIDNKNTVMYNYKNKNDKLIYSWMFDKYEISKQEKVNLDMDFESEFLSKNIDIDNDMKILSFDHAGVLPNHTSVKIYVGDKYKYRDEINMYYYDDDIELLRYKDSYIVDNNGYVKINLDHCSDYLLTSSIIQDAANNPANMSFVMFALLAIIILLIGVSLFSSNKK